jgi:hypothetical protein
MNPSSCPPPALSVPPRRVPPPLRVVRFESDIDGSSRGLVVQYEVVAPVACPTTTTVSVAATSSTGGASAVFGTAAAPGAGSSLPFAFVPAYAKAATCTWSVSAGRPASAPTVGTWTLGLNITLLVRHRHRGGARVAGARLCGCGRGIVHHECDASPSMDSAAVPCGYGRGTGCRGAWSLCRCVACVAPPTGLRFIPNALLMHVYERVPTSLPCHPRPH